MAEDDMQIHKGLVVHKSNGITRTLRACKFPDRRIEIRMRYDAIPYEPDKVIFITRDQFYAFLHSEEE